ncbi:MAG: PAS domain-containing protein, partial [Oscillospiraceae bacterium]|nr:PAS domain-containing protein [Oscillospiraceae bacterium]
MLSELLQSRVHYILNNMEDAVCLTEMNGELVYANPAAERLFGLDMDGRAKIWDAIPYVEGNDALIQLFIDGVMEKKKPLRAVVDYVN